MKNLKTILKISLLIFVAMSFTACSKSQNSINTSNTPYVVKSKAGNNLYREIQIKTDSISNELKKELNNSTSPKFNNYNREPEDELFIYKHLMRRNF